MDLNLKGKKVVVLGGTRGIGRGIADTFAGEGADVAICARNGEQVKATVAALKAKGVNSFGGTFDIADRDATRAWIAEAGKQLGGIDILISNAGAMVYTNSEADWEANFQVDLISGGVVAFEAAKPFLLDSAKAKGDAAFIMISSISAAQAYGPDSYGAIKSAMVHYAKGLSRAHSANHIRVNTVSPAGVLFEGGSWHTVQVNEPERFQQILGRQPMGRMATVEDVANAVVFLASPVSSYTTGINMIVDGGMLMRVNF